MLRVYYNGTTLVDSDYVYGVHQKFIAYDDKFFIGATPCREVTLIIDKQAWSTHPTYFTVKEYDGSSETGLWWVNVDNVDDTDDYYYKYTCLDSMVLFNEPMEFTQDTVYNLINGICTKHGMSAPSGITNSSYPGRMVVTWSDYCTEREFISYAAELIANVAYINYNNRLTFTGYKFTADAVTSNDDMADITVGATHNYTKVVYDNVVHYEYGTNDGETIYLNTDNILFSDNNGDSNFDTIEKQVNRIGLLVLGNTTSTDFGFSFTNVKSSNFVIRDTFVYGQPGKLGRITLTNYPVMLTFIQPDWNYNNGYWIGGINTELKTQEQEETEVIDSETKRAINSVSTRIDRQEGTIDLIGQRVDDTEDILIHLQVNSQAGEVRVTNEDANPPQSYTSFKGDGMRVYVEGQQVAEATASSFNCDKGLGVQDWAIEHGSDASVLIIYRRR